jgi:hypothetical protein
MHVGGSPLCHPRKGVIPGISSTGQVPGQTFSPTLLCLCPSLENARSWLSRLERNNYHLLKVSGKGRLHTANALLLFGASEPLKSLAPKRKSIDRSDTWTVAAKKFTGKEE